MADTQTNTETLGTNEALKLEAKQFVDSLKDEEFGFLGFFGTQWLRKKVFAYLINDNIRESAWGLFFKFTGSLGDKILSEKKKILGEKYPGAKAVWNSAKNKVDRLGSEVPVTAEASKASNALSSQVNEQRHNGSSASSNSKPSSTQAGSNTQLSENELRLQVNQRHNGSSASSGSKPPSTQSRRNTQPSENALSSQVKQRHNGSSASSDSKPPSTQSRRNTQLSENHSIDSARWAEIPRERVERAWNYINNDGTFYSPSKGICIRGKGQYKGVCTTGVWNVLHLLTGLPLPRNLEIDGTEERDEEMGQRLNAMNCYKIFDNVDPTNPSASGYVPKDGDVAIRPRFQSDHGPTQHMACYINGHWVSDTIQPRMSCYNATPQKKRNPYEPNVKIYRYNPNMNNIHYS